MFENSLSSKASADILNIPLSELGLTSDVLNVLGKRIVYKNNALRPEFETIGDLLRIGEAGFQDIILKRKAEIVDLNETYKDVNEKLAKLGLKFYDSDFTAGDVRVSCLQLDGDDKKFIESLKNIKTIDDLCIYGKRRLETSIAKSKLFVSLKNIEQAVERYGLTIDGFSIRSIKVVKAFPLNDFKFYLTPETRAKRCNETLNIDFNTLIENVFTSKRNIQAAHRVGLFTIDDVIHNYKKLSSERTVYVYVMMRDLAKYNLKFEGEDYEIENGQVVRNHRNGISFKVPNVIKVQNYNYLSKDEQEWFKNLSFEEFGLDPRAIKVLNEAGAYKVEDFMTMKYDAIHKIYQDSSFMYSYIVESFFKYDILNNSKKGNIAFNLQARKFRYMGENSDLKYLTSEQIKQLSSAELSALAVDEKLVEILRKDNITCLDDLAKYDISDFEKKYGNYITYALKTLLENFGLKFKNASHRVDKYLERVNEKIEDEEDEDELLEDEILSGVDATNDDEETENAK